MLFSADEIERAIDRLAVRVAIDLADDFPLVVCVMSGGLPFTADLIRRLPFALELDYVHATRYRGTQGGEIDFRALPRASTMDRNVLLVDDVLDEGYTLQAIREKLESDAATVRIAVLVDKPNARRVPITPDYAALEAGTDYLVGRGMDHEGLYRNLPSIHRYEPCE